MGAISLHRKERLPIYTVAFTALLFLWTFHFPNLQMNFCNVGDFLFMKTKTAVLQQNLGTYPSTSESPPDKLHPQCMLGTVPGRGCKAHEDVSLDRSWKNSQSWNRQLESSGKKADTEAMKSRWRLRSRYQGRLGFEACIEVRQIQKEGFSRHREQHVWKHGGLGAERILPASSGSREAVRSLKEEVCVVFSDRRVLFPGVSESRTIGPLVRQPFRKYQKLKMYFCQ